MKSIKDPIYGYIEIDKDIVDNIIDTNTFQRLRNIRQTSYLPLYPSSLHNRFTHSIGVYFLGKIAYNSLLSSSKKNNDISNIIRNIKEISSKTFLYACLLHDVGHAPFSHTGEKFFLNNESLNDKLIDIVNIDSFSIDVNHYVSKAKSAAPHEIMSAIVALRCFSNIFSCNEEKEFFSRCITGYRYNNGKQETDYYQILNIFIDLLNSSLIDVDKLDYLIRDSFMTGFKSITIDYERLLNSVKIVKYNDEFKLAYNKSALSIIESAIYAHDAERKWIQNHSVILYEHFLVQNIIKNVEKFCSNGEKGKLFSYSTVSSEGNEFSLDDNNGNKFKLNISLLSDEDVLFIAKNLCDNEYSKEYYSRNYRRKSIWKSEAEYRILFDQKLGEDVLDRLENTFNELNSFIVRNMDTPIINDLLIDKCNEKIKILEKNKDLSKEDNRTQLSGVEQAKTWALYLKEFATQNKIPFDFIIIEARKFKSNFSKKDIKKILIKFPKLNEIKPIEKVSNILEAKETRENFFHLYYYKGDNFICPKKFANFICSKLFNDGS